MSNEPTRVTMEQLRDIAGLMAEHSLSRVVVGDIILERAPAVEKAAGEEAIAALMRDFMGATEQGTGEESDPRLRDLAYPDGKAPTFKRTG